MAARPRRTLSVGAAFVVAACAALATEGVANGVARRATGAVAGPVAEQVAGQGAGGQQTPVFRASVEQVRLDVSVTRNGRPVAGLTAADFDVHDNGVPHPVTRLLQEEVPLRLLLVLDTSSSLAGDRLRALAAGAQSLVRSLQPDDEVGLVTFSQMIRLAVAPTAVHGDALAALGNLRAAGNTSWRDALFTAMQVAGLTTEARPVALLFTDGEDNASWMDGGAIVESVRRSGVVVHVVAVDRSRGAWGGVRPRSLERTVAAGGGELWLSESHERLGEKFRDVLAELRSRYLLVYTPKETPAAGWHEVRVRLKGARGEVRSRPGYFVPAP